MVKTIIGTTWGLLRPQVVKIITISYKMKLADLSIQYSPLCFTHDQ